MNLRFTKMHGLGNDFVVINAIEQSVELNPDYCRRIADRHFGIGCDQILLVEAPRDPKSNFNYRIFNADGTEVEQCGNGARCFARFVREQGLTRENMINVTTFSGRITLYIEDDGMIRVNMGIPRFLPEQIPFQAEKQTSQYLLDVNGEQLTICALSMGNPHAVMQVEQVDLAPVARLGPLIENHPRFPQRVNVGFMQILSRKKIKLRVFERGSGETLACGSGACAAVVSGQIQSLLDEEVEVNLPGGKLMINWQGDNNPVWMRGPASSVYQGYIEL